MGAAAKECHCEKFYRALRRFGLDLGQDKMRWGSRQGIGGWLECGAAHALCILNRRRELEKV